MSTIQQSAPAQLLGVGVGRLPSVLRAAGRGTARVLLTVIHVLWPAAFLLGVWALWIELSGLPPTVAPHPADVLRYIFENPGSYATDAANSLRIVCGGLVLGTAAGVAIASLSWFSSFARAALVGPTLITQCLPVITLVPVIARVFGYNERTVVFVAALIAFFPVMVFTSAGLRSNPPGTTDLFAVLGASRRQRFMLLAVPSAIPRLLVSLQLSVVVAVVGSMLAQWIMGSNGLGYRLAVAQASFRSSEAWGASVVAVLIGVTLYSAMSGLTRYAQRRFN